MVDGHTLSSCLAVLIYLPGFAAFSRGTRCLQGSLLSATTQLRVGDLLVDNWLQSSAKELSRPSRGCCSAREAGSCATRVPSLVVSFRSLSIFCTLDAVMGYEGLGKFLPAFDAQCSACLLPCLHSACLPSSLTNPNSRTNSRPTTLISSPSLFQTPKRA